MIFKIKACCNFQTCEVDYDDEIEDLDYCLKKCVEIVKTLDSNLVYNNVNNKKEEEVEEKASDKQIQFATKLGLNESEAKSMSKSEIWQWIQQHKK